MKNSDEIEENELELEDYKQMDEMENEYNHQQEVSLNPQILNNSKNLRVNPHTNTNINTNINTSKSFSKTTQINTKIQHESIKNKYDEKNYLKYRNDELNKELLEKLSEIHQLKETIRVYEVQIASYKKNMQKHQSDINISDTLKVDINILHKKINEMEGEINFHKVENMRLCEILQSKENIMSQFHSLVNVSSNKFKLFEEANQNLREENSSLKIKLEDFKTKIEQMTQKESVLCSSIEELKSKISRKDVEVEKLESEFSKKEENLKKRYEENEAQLKQKIKSREEELKSEFLKGITSSNNECEKTLVEIEKIKLEKKTLEQKIDSFENIIHEKEMDFKRALDQKDREYEKLFRNLKELQRDIREVEFTYKQKIEEIKSKNKNLEIEESESKKMNEINEKQIQQFKNELMETNLYLEDCMSSLKETEITLNNKESVIKTLKNENSELVRELHRKDEEIQHVVEKFNMKLETYNNKIKILEKEKEILFKEKEEDHKEIFSLRNKLNESTGLYNEKISYIEKDKEMISEKLSKEIRIKFEEKEDEYLSEISRLQNIILERDSERENLKLKFDKRSHSVNLF
jgi:chromosome segregation ATPase